jgi:regulator of protease activity HflC (stomatin/prohibitin superfamily)
MRATANRTLSQTLSENVAMLTGGMRATVQQEAEALGLGVEIVGFTVRGMHPPVRVADAYEAVVSAELGMVTAVVNARALRNQIVPAAEASAFARESTARAEGANAVARAAGEAWSFRTVESQYRAAGHEYLFRRRLETMEAGLAGRRFTVVDSRFQRDGGELWLPQ